LIVFSLLCIFPVLSSFLENFSEFVSILKGSRCHKLVKYQGRKVEFNVRSSQISVEFNTKVENIHPEIPRTAELLDNYNSSVWRLLSDHQSRKDLTAEDRRMLRLAMFNADNYMFQFGSIVEAFNLDPQRSREDLNDTIKAIRTFVASASPPMIKMTPQQRKVISDTTIGFTTRGKAKLWSVDNREAQVLDQTKMLQTRLMQVIMDRK
ncbi:MAG: hypothetical protein M3247_08635, partial [Thermoproteota archaeon]|nr:hypothetical protein [Thermoproteota archaeon]